jgi:ATP-dependent RNA helicase DeaD
MTEIFESDGVSGRCVRRSAADVNFSLADLPESLRAAAERMSWTELMPVQRQSIPAMLSGRISWSSPIQAVVRPELSVAHPASLGSEFGCTQALILAPTRELAVQVSRDAEELGGMRASVPYPFMAVWATSRRFRGWWRSSAHHRYARPYPRSSFERNPETLIASRSWFLTRRTACCPWVLPGYEAVAALSARGLQSAMFSATYPAHVKRLAQQFLRTRFLFP